MSPAVHSFAGWLEETPVSHSIKDVNWVIPLIQSIHIVMIGVVFVSCLMIAMRVLGRMRADEPFAVVWGRFAPWMWTGLCVMGVTGLTLVLGEPVREFTALSFWLKMGMVALGVASTAIYGRSLRHVVLVPSGQFPVTAKLASVLIVALWLAIIFLGRAIAYDREVWGSLSLHA